jgi:flagellar biosynthesis component FlhA
MASSLSRRGRWSSRGSETAVLTAVRKVINDYGDGRWVVVTRRDRIRPFVRKLLELEFPNLPVLAQRELLPGLGWEVSAVVELGEEGSDV